MFGSDSTPDDKPASDGESSEDSHRAAEGDPNKFDEIIHDADPEATIDRSDRPGYEEVYVVPEPDPGSARYRVFVLTATGRLHHVGTFDLATLARSESGFPAASIGAATSE